MISDGERERALVNILTPVLNICCVVVRPVDFILYNFAMFMKLAMHDSLIYLKDIKQ